MTREEYLQWAKERALKYVNEGNLTDAFSSLAADLNNNDETRDHIGLGLGMAQLVGGMLNTPQAMREFIEGFN